MPTKISDRRIITYKALCQDSRISFYCLLTIPLQNKKRTLIVCQLRHHQILSGASLLSQLLSTARLCPCCRQCSLCASSHLPSSIPSLWTNWTKAELQTLISFSSCSFISFLLPSGTPTHIHKHLHYILTIAI